MIDIRRADPAAAEFLPLHEAREAYAASLYPAESNHLFDPNAMKAPQMHFFGVWTDGRIAGCGGFWAHEDYAEIKSMWIEPTARGLKLGQRLLAHIEQEVRNRGLAVARLETGISQPEALGLYEKAGYRRIAPFGDYRFDPLSVFMEKVL